MNLNTAIPLNEENERESDISENKFFASVVCFCGIKNPILEQEPTERTEKTARAERRARPLFPLFKSDFLCACFPEISHWLAVGVAAHALKMKF